jgi:hypothetical protein
MISTKQTKTLSNALTPPKPKSSTHVADPNSAPAYADQSSSRLMTLPKEIRNDIYTYVFCDNIDRVNAPIKYDREGKAVMADAPAPVHLVRFLPPPKESILACRQLYSEMKGMYTAAYRAYWSDNWFICNARQFLPNSEYPPDKDMQHIRNFASCCASRRNATSTSCFKEGSGSARCFRSTAGFSHFTISTFGSIANAS